MDFKKIAKTSHPAYTWFWNCKITKAGIKSQLEEMYNSGIRTFYVLGEPKNFLPLRRRTHLSPEYLSKEYLDLLEYAYSLSQEMGMVMWLYNEGGFPSGMVCGKIRKQYPELAIKDIERKEVLLPKSTAYVSDKEVIASFVGEKHIEKGAIFCEDVTVVEYSLVDIEGNRTDNASRKNTEIFLKMTHEALKEKFGKEMGTNIKLMFDDEAFMGRWTKDYEKIFFQTYGYDVCDYIPYIRGDIECDTDSQYRAVSDYVMLCGDLVRNNYFLPMKEWLNKNNMFSTGHLDRDNFAHGCYDVRYGNVLKTLRTFDVPGIDVIWSQIKIPDDGKCCAEGYPFFPRIASSVANQSGHSRTVSESFAVYGAQLTPEQMRYAVSFQAVRGISLFNFMTISYDRKTAMCLQYRPNFIAENVGMDCLTQINTYTARISDILQRGKADVSTALYFPFRSLSAWGEKGRQTVKSFEEMGKMLEARGVDFDLIDEDFVLNAKVQDGALIGEHVKYQNVFVPNGFLEKEEVLQKIKGLGKEIKPCILRENKNILSRHIIMSENEEVYLISNLSCKKTSETVGIFSQKSPYIIDLQTGELYIQKFQKEDGKITLLLDLLCGETAVVYLTDKTIDAKPKAQYKEYKLLSDFKAYINREYVIDVKLGPTNIYREVEYLSQPLKEWDKAFSGEVTYVTTLNDLSQGEYLLDLGKVNYFAKVYINNEKVGEVTMPPYTVKLDNVKNGDELKIVVANTIANACCNTKYFDNQEKVDVGPYHDNMKCFEAMAPAGGLYGPVKIFKKI